MLLRYVYRVFSPDTLLVDVPVHAEHCAECQHLNAVMLFQGAALACIPVTASANVFAT